jgi:hypothetical protein
MAWGSTIRLKAYIRINCPLPSADCNSISHDFEAHQDVYESLMPDEYKAISEALYKSLEARVQEFEKSHKGETDV